MSKTWALDRLNQLAVAVRQASFPLRSAGGLFVPRKGSAITKRWYDDVPRDTRAAIASGYALFFFGVFGFGGWAALAPIEGAVVTPGVFIVANQNKVVQHFEGGIIREILVAEGQRVQAGQVLVKLDETAPRADLSRLLLRQLQLLATEARLISEEQAKASIVLSDELLQAAAADPDASAAVANQHSIFDARRRKLAADLSIQEQGIAALKQQTAGDQSRLDAVNSQLKLVAEELTGKTELYKRGLVRTPEYLAVRRLEANLLGEVGRLIAEIGDNAERIRATQEQMERIRTAVVQSAAEELHSVRSELKDVRERITAARGVLERILITAPVDGIVVKLNYHTPGGVIRPGNDILALLPISEDLVIEGRIRPQDIDHVKTGQPALVRLVALNQRTTPMIPATVIYLSADSLPNDRRVTDDNGFIARVKIDADGASMISHFRATPGMPAEIYIRTGQRTFFEYLIKPIHDTMSRSFRER